MPLEEKLKVEIRSTYCPNIEVQIAQKSRQQNCKFSGGFFLWMKLGFMINNFVIHFSEILLDGDALNIFKKYL